MIQPGKSSRLPFERLLDMVRALPFDATIDVDEDLSGQVRYISIEDPNGGGIGIDLIWTPNDLLASIGRELSIDLPDSLGDVESLLKRWMSSPAVERWQPRSNRIIIGEGAAALQYANSRGFPSLCRRGDEDVRRFQPYRPSAEVAPPRDEGGP